MISQETASRLASLLELIGESELEAEAIRQVLSEQPGFHPERAFDSLDFMSKDFITSDDLYKYLLDDSSVTPMSAYLLLKEWDLENRGKLFYSDFSKMILPFNHPSPRTPSQQGLACEYPLKKLLLTELGYIMQIEQAKQSLACRKDFSSSGCFNLLDDVGTGYIIPQNLDRFMQRNKVFQAGYIDAIMRRLDRDNDGKISYTEFIQAVTPALKVYGSENNFTSVFSPVPSAQQTPAKAKVRVFDSGRGSEGKKKITSIGKFARFLIQQLTLEKELEAERKKLALRVDFSIGKLFALMDEGQSGGISIKQMEDNLRKIGIIPELNQCHLLFRQYDRDNDNYLTFWDFCDIFTPRTTEYSELLLSRVTSKQQKEDFSLETLDMIVDAFILILNIQSVTEELKQKLYSGIFNVNKVFEKADMNSLGFLTRGCFRNLLRKHKIYATDRDLEGILFIYDANKDGKITYSKFVQGLCPRYVNNI